MIGSRRARLWLVLAFAIAVLGLLAMAGPGQLQSTFFYLAPFLSLVFALGIGFYPGERLIEALAARRVTRTRDSSKALPRYEFAALLPRGGRLLANALAGRAPPRRFA